MVPRIAGCSRTSFTGRLRLCLSFVVAIAGLLVCASAAGTPSQTPPQENFFKKRRIHGFLMWSAMGLSLPVGILIVRMTKGAIQRGDSINKIHTLRRIHIGVQLVGIALSVAGGTVALKNFGKEFRYTHERLGLSLLISTWAMPFLGLVRPDRGQPVRPFWYALHWLVGTATVILGFINIYIGMHVYELISSKSLRTWNILFSIQLSVMGLIYLAQDRWGYLKEQGQMISKPVAPPLVSGQVAPGSNGKRSSVAV